MGFCAYIGISGRFYGDFSMGAQVHCEIPIFARNPEKRGIMGGPLPFLSSRLYLLIAMDLVSQG